MKQTTTEIFIEVEEIIQVKSEMRQKSLAKQTKAGKSEAMNQLIEICPHCGQAILEPTTVELDVCPSQTHLFPNLFASQQPLYGGLSL